MGGPMKVFRKLLIIMFISFLLGHSSVLGAAAKPLATYTGSNKIQIISYHSQWKSSSKLQKVWQELMRNTHYGELKYLKKINIRPGIRASNYVGRYYTKNGKRYYFTTSEINYYPDRDGGDNLSLAKTLAHEYGHHYTMYYLWIKEGIQLDTDSWKKSKYAKTRGLVNNSQVSENAEHKWKPAEIAAEDYFQLLGSINGRKAVNTNGLTSWNTDMYNIRPQENMGLTLAAQVSNLYSYLLGLAGQKTTNKNMPPKAPTLSFDEVWEDNIGRLNFRLKWTKSGDDKPNPITYTVLEYANLLSIPTPIAFGVDKLSGEKPLGVNEVGVKYYRVLALDPQGMIVSSNLININLTKLRQDYNNGIMP
jgi:hypothetical protein